MDTFDVEAPYVGLLKNITVGHENKGYGGGIFIDRVVVTELQTDSLQYYFPFAKWFDSGQVDGKLERSGTCAGYQKLSEQTTAATVDGSEMQLPSKGRWNVRIRTDRAIPETLKSSLFLTAYGTFGRSDMIPFPSDFQVASGAEYSFDVEFGDLGDLFKLRFDSNIKQNQAWLLDWVELKDLDTGEQMRMIANKWFCHQAPDGTKVTNPQVFREVAVLKIGVEPLPSFQYNVSLRTSIQRDGCKGPFHVQLTGEFGDSGTYLLPEFDSKKEQDLQLVIESVSLGRLMFVSVSSPLTDKGITYSEGFRALQEIYDRHGVPASVAPDWVLHKATVRESLHAPYQFIFGDSRIVEPDNPSSLRKQLTLTDHFTHDLA